MRKLALLIFIILFVGCEDPYKNKLFRAYEEQPIASWLSEQPEFSHWVGLLKKSNLYNALNLSINEFTCFVADNNSVEQYIANHTDYNSVEQMTDEDVDFLMRYHIIIGGKITSSNLLLKLSLPTATGDYLTAGIDVDSEQRYIDNGDGKERSYVVDKDVAMSNGIVHRVDNLLQPFTETIWDIVSTNPRYTIFGEAVEACGLDEWLDRSFLEIEDVTIRDHKTLFMVSDEIFKSKGINSLDDLKAKFGGDPKDEQSDFYQYMIYHIMNKLSGYAELTDFPAGYNSMILYTSSKLKGLSIIDKDNQIWFNPDTENFRIIDSKRDIPSKNGYIHEIDNLMSLPEYMSQFVVEWEPTDRLEYQMVPFYRAEKLSGSSIQKFSILDKKIPGVRWESIPAGRAEVWYHSEFVDKGRYLHSDALYWNMGNIGWLEMDIPVLPKGKYTLTCEKSNDATNGGRCSVFWDEVAMGPDRNFINGDTTGKWGDRILVAEETHTMRFVVGSVGGIFGIDRIIFVPVI